MNLSTYLHPEPLAYRGPELRPHFLLERFRVEGSVLAAFSGPCEVQTEDLVDWEDRLANDSIRARRMLHFLGEFFGLGLREGVVLQRLLMAQIAELLLLQGVTGVSREGDDLFWQGRKLSVSIVTVSRVSVLLHAGLNIDPTGAPVPAVGLEEWGIAPEAFARAVLERFQTEWASIERATTKVRGV